MVNERNRTRLRWLIAGVVMGVVLWWLVAVLGISLAVVAMYMGMLLLPFLCLWYLFRSIRNEWYWRKNH